jgi:FixJ family two-component response regulator
MFNDQVVHVVEDDLTMQALLLLLTSASLPARCYPSAEDFLAKENCGRWARLLVDVRLHGMDGLALQKHLLVRGSAMVRVQQER